MVDAINAALSATATKKDATSLSGNFDTFLKLLTTQLKNQDPLAPTDTNQFTQQLVQYSQVEQQIKMNDKLTNLVNLQGNIQTQAALSYIGLDVKTAGNDFNYAASGNYNIDYSLAGTANKTQIGIIDDKGNLVKTLNGDTAIGSHTAVWDGTDNDGNAVKAGQYHLSVGSLAADGSSVAATTYVTNRVTGVQNAADGTLQLMLGKIPTDLTKILSASLPGSNV